MDDYGQVNVTLPDLEEEYSRNIMMGQRKAPAGGEGTFSRLGAAVGGMADQRQRGKYFDKKKEQVQSFLEDASRRFSNDPAYTYRNYQEMAILRGVSGNPQVKEYGELIKQATIDKTRQKINQPAEEITRWQDVGTAPAEVVQGQRVYDSGRVGIETNPMTGEQMMQPRTAPEGLSRMGTFEPLPGEGRESPYSTPATYAERRRAAVLESGLPQEEQKYFEPDLQRSATLEGTQAMGGAGTRTEALMSGLEATGGEYTQGMKDVAGMMPREKDVETQNYKDRYLKMRQRDQDISAWKALLRDAQLRQGDIQKVSNAKADLLTEQRKVEKELADIKNGRPVKDMIGDVTYEMDAQWQEMYRGRQEILDGIRTQLTELENIKRRAESNRQLRNPSRHVDYTGGSGGETPTPPGKGTGF